MIQTFSGSKDEELFKSNSSVVYLSSVTFIGMYMKDVIIYLVIRYISQSFKLTIGMFF